MIEIKQVLHQNKSLYSQLAYLHIHKRFESSYSYIVVVHISSSTHHRQIYEQDDFRPSPLLQV